MDVHQRYSVSAYRRKIASERSKANNSVKYQVRTFHIDFGNNLMFQLKLRKDDAENLHLQIIKSLKCFPKPC